VVFFLSPPFLPCWTFPAWIFLERFQSCFSPLNTSIFWTTLLFTAWVFLVWLSFAGFLFFCSWDRDFPLFLFMLDQYSYFLFLVLTQKSPPQGGWRFPFLFWAPFFFPIFVFIRFP